MPKFYPPDLIDFVSNIRPSDEVRFLRWQLKFPRSDSKFRFFDLIKKDFGGEKDDKQK